MSAVLGRDWEALPESVRARVLANCRSLAAQCLGAAERAAAEAVVQSAGGDEAASAASRKNAISCAELSEGFSALVRLHDAALPAASGGVPS